jgi:hypothetical protein
VQPNSPRSRCVDAPCLTLTKESIFVQWKNYAVEDEMSFDELISTRTFADKLPVVVAELPLSEEESPTIH